MDEKFQKLPLPVRKILATLNHDIKILLSESYLGCYLHGSLALGASILKKVISIF